MKAETIATQKAGTKENAEIMIAPGGRVHFGFFVCDRRVQTRGAGLGQSYFKIRKVRRINAKIGFHFSLILQAFRRGAKLLNNILPTLITRRSQVRVLSPQPCRVKITDFVIFTLFCCSSKVFPCCFSYAGRGIYSISTPWRTSVR